VRELLIGLIIGMFFQSFLSEWIKHRVLVRDLRAANRKESHRRLPDHRPPT